MEEFRRMLSVRIEKVLVEAPLLASNVVDIKSQEPKWCKSAAIATEEMLRVIQMESAIELEGLLEHQRDMGMSILTTSSSPLFRVFLYQTDNRLLVGLSIHHCLADGKGASTLLELLLSSEKDFHLKLPSITGFKKVPEASEVYFDLRPSWKVLTLVIYKALVVPILPKFLKSRLEDKPFWPFEALKTPAFCKPKLILLQFTEKGFLQDLKGVSHKMGVKTVHPVIHAAILAALSASTTDGEELIGDESCRQFIPIKSDTPVNLRTPENGLIFGNYVSNFSWKDEDINPNSNFWEMTRDYDQHLNSKEGRAISKSVAGMLAYIPDQEKVDSERTDKEPTQWESFFWKECIKTPNPFGGSFSLSNLGALNPSSRIGETNLRLGQVAFCQTPSTFSSALFFDVCGIKQEDGVGGGLSISVGWRDGALENSQVEEIARRVESTLQKVSRGEIGESMTFQDLM